MSLHERTFKTRLLKGTCELATLKGETFHQDTRIAIFTVIFQWFIFQPR
ncbi:MAG: hypothetical protein ACLGIP_08020 [Alphaproteobacteria bacterium]|jgi:hypothetical protein